MSETPITAIDRSERSGSPGLVLLLAAALVAIAAAFSFLPPDQAGRLLKALLAVLAMVGVLALFAYAVGFLQFSGQSVKNDITKVIADTGSDGLLVTEGDSRVIYANEGIAQVIFFEGEEPETSYADRRGKYQGQHGITLPRL